ncbi:MAG: hypothetical protein ACI9QV_000297 [Methylophagaceae bacterium]|jgi:hypothetical protein
MGHNSDLDTNNSANVKKILGLLSRAEKNFLHSLKKAVGKETVIFSKVAINDALLKQEVATDFKASDYGDKLFDFLIYDETQSFIVCAIELDDRSHSKQKFHPEQSYQALCDDAAIPLMEIPARCGYDIAALRSEVFNYLQLKHQNQLFGVKA